MSNTPILVLDEILYPAISPFDSGYLSVPGSHQIYYEQSGNPDGVPVVFVHGGPGGGTTSTDRRFFNPDQYRIILFDQRGCGNSRFEDPLHKNTTWELIDDMERLRRHLGINTWMVFGGSWGSTLSLLYAIKNPDVISGLIVHGIFLVTQEELNWAYRDGANRVFTDQYHDFLKLLDETEFEDPLSAYAGKLQSKDEQIRLQAARAWDAWESAISFIDQRYNSGQSSDRAKYLMSLIETFYFTSRGFMPDDDFILENASALSAIPGYIIQGRLDMICPFKSAWRLNERWEKSELKIVDYGGHAKTEPAMASSIIEVTDRFITQLM